MAKARKGRVILPAEIRGRMNQLHPGASEATIKLVLSSTRWDGLNCFYQISMVWGAPLSHLTDIIESVSIYSYRLLEGRFYYVKTNSKNDVDFIDSEGKKFTRLDHARKYALKLVRQRLKTLAKRHDAPFVDETIKADKEGNTGTGARRKRTVLSPAGKIPARLKKRVEAAVKALKEVDPEKLQRLMEKILDQLCPKCKGKKKIGGATCSLCGGTGLKGSIVVRVPGKPNQDKRPRPLKR